MSNSFQERFKNKTSLMPSGGIVNISLSPPPGQSEMQSKSPDMGLKASSTTSPMSLNLKSLIPAANSDRNMIERPSRSKLLIRSDRTPPNPLIYQQKSASPVHKKLSFLEENKEKLNKSSTRIYYKPYSIKDYKNIKFQKYFVLGGLGAQVGSEDWLKKKELLAKRAQYGRVTYFNNAANFPNPSQKHRSLEVNSFRKRAMEFAKTIVRPPLRVPLLTSD